MGTSCSSPVLPAYIGTGIRRSPSGNFLQDDDDDDDSAVEGTPTRRMEKKLSSRKFLYHPNSGADEKEPSRRLTGQDSKKNTLLLPSSLYSPMSDGGFSPIDSSSFSDKKLAKKRSKSDLIEHERIRMANDLMSPDKVASRNCLLSPIRIDVRTVNKIELSLENGIGLTNDLSSNELKGRYLVEEKLDGPYGTYL